MNESKNQYMNSLRSSCLFCISAGVVRCAAAEADCGPSQAQSRTENPCNKAWRETDSNRRYRKTFATSVHMGASVLATCRLES